MEAENCNNHQPSSINHYQTLHLLLLALALVSIALSTGCATYGQHLRAATNDPQAVTIYVLGRWLHSGVIVPEADIPPGVWPERKILPHTKFLEAGWGDAEGYRYPRTTRIVFRAMFASRGSVLLFHGFNGSITNEYAGYAKEIIRVQVSRPGFARLCRFIEDTYVLDSQGRPIPLPSKYAREQFFRANGHYWMLHNCNHWTGRALQVAGLPMSPRLCLLPFIVMHETRRSGTVIWRRGRPTAKPSFAQRKSASSNP